MMKNFLRSGLKINKLATNILFGISSVCIVGGNANAISLDSFADYSIRTPTRLEVHNNIVSQLNASAVQTNASAVGSTRSVELSAPNVAIQAGEVHLGYSSGFGNPNSITHNSSFQGSAQTFLSYDGDNKVGLTNYSGLNLDLKTGNADKLQFDVWYDFPFNQPMKLEFTFYDRSDATGNTFSRGIYLVDQPYASSKFGEISLSFSALSIFGSNGAANLSNIGAFSVLFDGSKALAADFAFSNFRTNGNDTSVPEPMTVGLLISGMVGLVRRKRMSVRSVMVQ